MTAPQQEHAPLPGEEPQRTAIELRTESLPAEAMTNETAIAAAAAQAKAAVEARYLVALSRPRSFDRMRVKLLETCKRPGFADSAVYNKPVGNGKKVRGMSIRFAEEAARAMGNIFIDCPITFDNDEKRIIRVDVTDLESNTTYSQSVVIEKTVERKSLKPGEKPISQRVNSAGEVTYLLPATEDAILTKQMAITSKHIRNGIMRMVPGDIVDEAEETINATAQKRDAEDPTAAKKRIIDGFYQQGVDPTQLVDYLGHALEHCTTAEIGLLRTIWTALKEGETNWPEVMATKQGANGNGKSGAASLKDRVAAKTKPDPKAESKPEASDAENLELDRKLAEEEQ